MDKGSPKHASPEDPEHLPTKQDERQKKRLLIALVFAFLLASAIFGAGLWWLLRRRGSSSHHSSGSASPSGLDNRPLADEDGGTGAPQSSPAKQPSQSLSSGIRLSVSEPANMHLSSSSADICTFFPTCFPSLHKSDSDAEMQECRVSMRYNFQSYYTAIATDEAGGGAIGILNVKPIRGNPNVAALIIYNVCVHPEYRRRGIASRMLTEALPHIMDLERQTYLRLLEKYPQKYKNPPIVLALDVYWEDAYSAEAFAMYAKLGFTDHLQAVEDIEDLPFEKVASGELSDSSLLEKAADAVGEAALKVPDDGRVGSCFAMLKVVDKEKPPLRQQLVSNAVNLGKILRKHFFQLKAKGATIISH